MTISLSNILTGLAPPFLSVLIFALSGCDSDTASESEYKSGEITMYDGLNPRCIEMGLLDAARGGALSALIENQDWTSDSIYYVNELEESNVLETTSIQFDAALDPDGAIFEFNSNLPYIYAGDGSAKVSSVPFKAKFLGKTDELKEVSFWVYFDGEQNQSFQFKWWRLTFSCLFDESGSNGGGGGGLGDMMAKEFSVEPNVWTKLDVDLSTEDYRPLDLYFEISTQGLGEGADTEFYLDEIEFQ